MSQPEKSRSSFVYKLHEILSAEQHPEWLRWINNDTFGITSVESQAKAALSPQWEFRSLASFIRQLSYYSFKRLSDRRRSAERRSHNPSLIVFTHTSGNFVRDDISKTLNIPRKLRSRKKSTNGSRRKSSTASSIAFDYEYQERTPSPEPHYATQAKEEDAPTQTHLSLTSYQLQPWTVVNPAQAVSSPRTLPMPAPVSASVPTLSAREVQPTYEYLPADSPLARSYPSPVVPGPAPNPSAYTYDSPTSLYQDQFTPQTQTQYLYPTSTNYYYPPPPQHAPPPASSSTTYGSNELPPIRTITSNLVAPPSPPPDAYARYSSHQIAAPQPLPRRSSHVFAEEVEAPIPPPVAPPASSIPSGLVAMQQINSYYPPSPPPAPSRPVIHPTRVPPQQHQYYPSPTSYSCASDYQQGVNRGGEWVYTTSAYH